VKAGFPFGDSRKRGALFYRGGGETICAHNTGDRKEGFGKGRMKNPGGAPAAALGNKPGRGLGGSRRLPGGVQFCMFLSRGGGLAIFQGGFFQGGGGGQVSAFGDMEKSGFGGEIKGAGRGRTKNFAFFLPTGGGAVYFGARSEQRGGPQEFNRAPK